MIIVQKEMNEIIQVSDHIHLEHFLFFRVSHGYLNFKVILMIFS